MRINVLENFKLNPSKSVFIKKKLFTDNLNIFFYNRKEGLIYI